MSNNKFLYDELTNYNDNTLVVFSEKTHNLLENSNHLYGLAPMLIQVLHYLPIESIKKLNFKTINEIKNIDNNIKNYENKLYNTDKLKFLSKLADEIIVDLKRSNLRNNQIYRFKTNDFELTLYSPTSSSSTKNVGLSASLQLNSPDLTDILHMKGQFGYFN